MRRQIIFSARIPTGVSYKLTSVGVQVIPELLLSVVEMFFEVLKSATFPGDVSFCTFITHQEGA
ncbi:MAG: hypothetical protein H0U76_19275 [Ktedonobacteraceae bacterium]|nr:hypothetical protein [Ktedonobacteraceae bacterium]